ncbi:MAG: Clp protease N-terminal domain-containing protein [Acidimicrobiales bacterium]
MKAHGSEARLSLPNDVVERADGARAELHDEYLSTEHLLLALADQLGSSRRGAARRAQSVRGSHRHQPEPRR